MNRLDLVPFRLLVDQVGDHVRRHIGTLFWPTAVPLLATSILLVVLQQRWMRAIFGSGSDAALDSMNGAIALFALFAVVLFFSLALYMLAYVALAVAAVDAVAGRPIDLVRAWRFALRPAVLGTSILCSIAVFLAFLFCLVPGFFVAPLFALLVPVMVEEDLYGGAAMARSARLLTFNRTGRWSDSGWAASAVLLFVGTALSTCASTVTQGPFVFVQQYLLTRQAAGGQAPDPLAVAGNLWLQVPAQVLGSLVTVAVWAFYAFGLALLFFEVRRRKEAPDLEVAITQLVGPGDAASAEATS